MKLKTKVTVFFLILTLSATYAQNQELDKITLNNKTSYTGKLVAQKPGEHIRFIVENTSDTLLILMDNIEEISKVQVKSISETTQYSKISSQIYSPNRFQTALSYYQGGGDVRYIGFGLGMQYWMSTKFALGLTTSYLGETGSGAGRGYPWQKVPLTIESVYEYQKYSDNRMALYTKLGIGYSFTLNGNYYDNFLEDEFKVTNGFVFNPGLGFRYNVTKNLGAKLDISYLLIADQNKRANGEKLSNLHWNAVMMRLSMFF